MSGDDTRTFALRAHTHGESYEGTVKVKGDLLPTTAFGATIGSAAVPFDDAFVEDLDLIDVSDSSAPGIDWRRRRVGPAAVQDNDLLSAQRMYGYDGTADIEAGGYDVRVDGTPGTNNMPAELIISTNPGAATVTEVWRFAPAGHFEALGAYNINLNGPTISSGTGSPEGAVTAPVGSLYLRTDGGLLSTLYVKESGAGNTGWAGK